MDALFDGLLKEYFQNVEERRREAADFGNDNTDDANTREQDREREREGFEEAVSRIRSMAILFCQIMSIDDQTRRLGFNAFENVVALIRHTRYGSDSRTDSAEKEDEDKNYNGFYDFFAERRRPSFRNDYSFENQNQNENGSDDVHIKGSLYVNGGIYECPDDYSFENQNQNENGSDDVHIKGSLYVNGNVYAGVPKVEYEIPEAATTTSTATTSEDEITDNKKGLKRERHSSSSSVTTSPVHISRSRRKVL
jgi:hypothetical protein